MHSAEENNNKIQSAIDSTRPIVYRVASRAERASMFAAAIAIWPCWTWRRNESALEPSKMSASSRRREFISSRHELWSFRFPCLRFSRWFGNSHRESPAAAIDNGTWSLNCHPLWSGQNRGEIISFHWQSRAPRRTEKLTFNRLLLHFWVRRRCRLRRVRRMHVYWMPLSMALALFSPSSSFALFTRALCCIHALCAEWRLECRCFDFGECLAHRVC